MKTVYEGDPRYEAIKEKMDMLGIKDTSSPRQVKNGTIEWQLPIKNTWPLPNPEYIKVASFATGYVRNQNSGHSNYQLNKRCMNEPEYYKSYEWKDGEQVWDGKYRKFETRGCKLIPIEIERLEYMLDYCIKNYFIKRANEVANGKYVPKWRLEYELECAKEQEAINSDIHVVIGGMKYKLYGAK